MIHVSPQHGQIISAWIGRPVIARTIWSASHPVSGPFAANNVSDARSICLRSKDFK